jgi:hypothetical protein
LLEVARPSSPASGRSRSVRSIDIFPDFQWSPRERCRGPQRHRDSGRDAADERDVHCIAVTSRLPIYDPRFERRWPSEGACFIVGTRTVMGGRSPGGSGMAREVFSDGHPLIQRAPPTGFCPDPGLRG